MHRKVEHSKGTTVLNGNGTHPIRKPELKAPVNSRPVRIVHLEDNQDDADLTIALLRRAGLDCSITHVTDRQEFIYALEGEPIDVVLSELTLSRFDGMEALTIVRDHYPHIPFIFLSGTMGEDTAIESLLHGARDFVLKQSMYRLGPAIRRVLAEEQESKKRRKAEEEILALHRWASRVASIVASSPVVAFSWIPEAGWPVSFVSDNVAQFGYHPDDFLRDRLPYAAIIHPDDLQRTVEAVDAFRAVESTEMKLEYRILKKNGDIVWVEEHTTVTRDARNAVLTADGIIIDITERKLREIESELNKARLEKLHQLASMEYNDEAVLIDQMLASAVTLTASDFGSVHFISDKENAIKGSVWSGKSATNCDLKGSDHFMFEAGGSWSECLHRRKSVIKNDVEVTGVTLAEPGGHALFGRHIVVPIIVEGKVVMLAGVENKIDPYDEGDVGVLQLMMVELWRMLKHLRGTIERKKLWQAVEKSPVSITVTDTKGIIGYANPRMLEMTGYRKEEVLGRGMNLLQSGETSPMLYEQLWSTILEGREWKGTMKNKRKNGQVFWESVSISPVSDQKGTIVSFVSTGEDVSESIATEKALIAARREAERAAKLKDNFIAMISHEIRTPLNIIFGYAGLIKEMYEELIDPDDRFMFESIEDAGHRLMRTVDQIIAASVFGAGSYTPVIERFDVLDSLECMLKKYQQKATDKGLNLELIRHEKSLMVRLDRFGFEQAMRNLIDNALKFTTVGGVSVRTSVDAERLRIDIHDTGKGMSLDFTQNAFSKFTQEIEGYSRPYEGLGLGLALVRNYAAINNGSVTLESKSGKGSTFSLFYPLSL